jgi:hypothetical protein
MTESAKITVVVEMKDGSLCAIRERITGNTVEFVGDMPDKANVRRIAGNFQGWGAIPPIPEWTWHYDHSGHRPSSRPEPTSRLRFL